MYCTRDRRGWGAGSTNYKELLRKKGFSPPPNFGSFVSPPSPPHIQSSSAIPVYTVKSMRKSEFAWERMCVCVCVYENVCTYKCVLRNCVYGFSASGCAAPRHMWWQVYNSTLAFAFHPQELAPPLATGMVYVSSVPLTKTVLFLRKLNMGLINKGWYGMFFAWEVWYIADVWSINPSSKQ